MHKVGIEKTEYCPCQRGCASARIGKNMLFNCCVGRKWHRIVRRAIYTYAIVGNIAFYSGTANAIVMKDPANDPLALQFANNALFSGVGAILEPSLQTQSLCAGSLVSPMLVLTAAHCVNNYSASAVNFYLTNYLGSDPSKPTATAIGVSEIIINPLFNQAVPEDRIYDMALLKLNSPAPMSDISYQVSASPGGNIGNIVGYGKSGSNGSVEDYYKRSATNFIKSSSVDGYSIITFNNPPNMNLNSRLEGFPCEGDSGSPLLFGPDMLTAVLTGGTSCGPGGTAYYVRANVQGNRDFPTSNGVEVLDEPAGIYSIAAALAALCVGRAFGAGRSGRGRERT